MNTDEFRAAVKKATKIIGYVRLTNRRMMPVRITKKNALEMLDDPLRAWPDPILAEWAGADETVLVLGLGIS